MLLELGAYNVLRKDPTVAWQFMRLWLPAVIRVLAPNAGYGVSRLPRTGGAVLAANHLSAIDPPAIGVYSTRSIRYMTKVELLEVPIAGEFLRMAGTFAVRRGEGDRDSLRVARWLVGARTRRRHVHRGHAAEVRLSRPGALRRGDGGDAGGRAGRTGRYRHVRLVASQPAAVRTRVRRADRPQRPATKRPRLQGGGRASSKRSSTGCGGSLRRPSRTVCPTASATGRRASPRFASATSSGRTGAPPGRQRTGRKAHSARSTRRSPDVRRACRQPPRGGGAAG